jgi:type VI secretion system secreted protein Hcp
VRRRVCKQAAFSGRKLAIVALNAYVSIKGQKQGQFAGDGSDSKNKNRILINSFSMSAASPHDLVTGRASGKRQWKPLVIQKLWSAASVQIYQALVTNETLTSVLIEFVTVSQEGEHLDRSISLTNASITQVSELPSSTQSPIGNELEEVSFVFQKIEIKDKSGKVFIDDWQA